MNEPRPPHPMNDPKNTPAFLFAVAIALCFLVGLCLGLFEAASDADYGAVGWWLAGIGLLIVAQLERIIRRMK